MPGPEMAFRIGIVGSRRRDSTADCLKLERCLIGLLRELKGYISLVSGGCPKGADKFAEILAAKHSLAITIHLPNRAKLDQRLLAMNPRAAFAKINYARNALIARDADILIACVADDRKGGTEDTIKRFIQKHEALDEKKLIQKRRLFLI